MAEERKLSLPALEITELDRDPGWRPSWAEPATLQRVLAHLAAIQGGISRLLRATANGALRVAVEDDAGDQALVETTGRLRTYPYGYAGSPFAQVTGGALVTVPYFASTDGYGAVAVALAAASVTTHDFGSSATRMVRVQVDMGPAIVYASASAGAKDAIRGMCYYCTLIEFYTSYRYLDFDNSGGAATAMVQHTQF